MISADKKSGSHGEADQKNRSKRLCRTITCDLCHEKCCSRGLIA